MNDLDRAITLALEAHRGQTDQIGRPYFEHCQRVASRLRQADNMDARVVAYLHDVPEKAPGWSLARLRELGFPSSVFAAVEALTRRPRESDEDLVRRAVAEPLARPVKRADLEDNAWQTARSGEKAKSFQVGPKLLDSLVAGYL